MSKKPTNLPQDPFEQLKAKTGYFDFITEFAMQLHEEKRAIKSALEEMSQSIMKAHVKRWADNTDLIGAATGFGQSKVPTVQDKENSIIVDGMASEMPDELGGLRTFRPDNDEYLDSMIESTGTEPTAQNDVSNIPNTEDALANVFRIHAEMEERDAA